MSIFSKINFGLSKTRNKMSGAIDDMLDSFDSFEEDLYTELEEILVMGDVGVNTAVQVVEELKERVKSEKIKKTSVVKKELENIIADLLYGGEDMGLITIPSVILMIGVNGAGKTTTIGKLAAMYKAQGKKVILGAADTFRAAAIDQLDVWAQRAGVDIVKHKEGADPAAVVYDTIQAGIARNCDIIILDTAGRLHNKKHLMEELAKIFRVMDKELPYADREVLLVLDAVTGQNAVNQAREFAGVTELPGIVLTKLDGTARGGVVLSIKNDLKIPVKFIGVGEGLDDLQSFDPAAFAKSLFEEGTKKENEDENTLEELINSEEYQNYVPAQEEDNEELEAFAQAAGELLSEIYGESEGEVDGAADEGQKDESAAVAQAEGAEEAAEETDESGAEVSEEGQEPDGGDDESADHAAEASPDITVTESTVEAPVVEEPVTEEPVIEEPVVEEPVIEEPVVEEPVVEEPVVEEPVVEEPVIETPTPQPVPQPAPQPEEPKKKERKGFFGLFRRG